MQAPSYSVVDCRGLVKTLVSGVKTITWGVSSCKTPLMGAQIWHSICFINPAVLIVLFVIS